MIEYEKDYAAWLDMTAAQLKKRMFASIDWDNLIEELVDMGKSEKRAVESLLVRLLEHLLKLKYWEAESPLTPLNKKETKGRIWRSEIVNFRYQLLKSLKESPSLKKHLENYFEEAIEVAMRSVSELTELPDTIEIDLENVLDEKKFKNGQKLI